MFIALLEATKNIKLYSLFLSRFSKSHFNRILRKMLVSEFFYLKFGNKKKKTYFIVCDNVNTFFVCSSLFGVVNHYYTTTYYIDLTNEPNVFFS